MPSFVVQVPGLLVVSGKGNEIMHQAQVAFRTLLSHPARKN